MWLDKRSSKRYGWKIIIEFFLFFHFIEKTEFSSNQILSTKSKQKKKDKMTTTHARETHYKFDYHLS